MKATRIAMNGSTGIGRREKEDQSILKSVLYVTIVTVCAALFCAPLQASPASSPFNRPLVFEPNKGQFAPEAQWMARGPAYQIFIAKDSATFALWESVEPNQRAGRGRVSRMPEAPLARLSTVRMTLNGSRRWNGAGQEPTGGFSNYLVGSDSKRWQTGIPQYGRVKISAVYPGVDLVFYGANNDLEYDFLVAPGADATQIRLSFSGGGGVRIDGKTGDLVVTTATGSELRTHRPKVYQEIGDGKVEIHGGYTILESGEVAFTLASYDARRPLVIDPTITFTTFVQGNGEDFPNAIAVDPGGNSYITGFTFSWDYPQKPGFGAIPGKSCTTTGNSTICPPYGFITKFSPTGAMLFSTLFGGSGADFGNAIAADFNSIYVAGVTSSANFEPALNSSYHGGAFDGFVMKVSSLGDQIDYSQLLGGNNLDSVKGIAIDSTQSAVVVGLTHSTDFPTSAQAMQKTKVGGSATADAFVTKLSPAGAILYSTYLGGSDSDEALAVTLDGLGSVYVTGDTASTNFPHFGTSHGAPSGGGTFTAFFTKLVPELSVAVYSITVGGGFDQGNSIALDPSGNIFIAGTTASTLFPTTAAAFQRTKPTPPFNGIIPTKDAWVVELNSASNLMFATYLGGSDANRSAGSSNGESFGDSIAVNSSGQVYVSGATAASNFPGGPPLTPNPTAGFLVKFGPGLASIDYRIFLGAEIKNIAVPPPPRRRIILSPLILTGTQIYTTGYRFRPNSDVKNLANTDAFVVKVDDSPVLVSAPVLASAQ